MVIWLDDDEQSSAADVAGIQVTIRGLAGAPVPLGVGEYQFDIVPVDSSRRHSRQGIVREGGHSRLGGGRLQDAKP